MSIPAFETDFPVKDALREISGRLGRIESRMRRAFPQAFVTIQKIGPRVASDERQMAPSLSPEQALKLYDELVDQSKAGDRENLLMQLSAISVPDLLLMSRELGVTLGKKKTSRKALTDAIVGRITQSVLLSKHVNRAPTDAVSGEDTVPDDTSHD